MEAVGHGFRYWTLIETSNGRPSEEFLSKRVLGVPNPIDWITIKSIVHWKVRPGSVNEPIKNLRNTRQIFMG